MEQNEESRIRPIYRNLGFDKGIEELNGRRKLFSITCARVTRHTYGKKIDLNLFLSLPIQKLN